MPACVVLRFACVDGEHEPAAAVRPTGQREPRVAEPGPRRAIGRARREREATEQPWHPGAMADDVTQLDLLRTRDHVGEAMLAHAAHLACDANPDEGGVAGAPRDHGRRPPRGDDRGRRYLRYRQCDAGQTRAGACDREPGVEQMIVERSFVGVASLWGQHYTTSRGVAMNSVHTPNVSEITFCTSRPLSRMICANSSAGGNAATEVCR